MSINRLQLDKKYIKTLIINSEMSLNQCRHNRAFSRAECCDTRWSAASKAFYGLEAAVGGGYEWVKHLYLSECARSFGG